MKHLALGWACNLNNLFVRFPYEKCKSIIKNIRVKREQLRLIKNIMREGIKVVIDDVIDNNVTFKVPSFGYYGGEIHFQAFKDQEFIDVRKKGKFKEIDFLATNFTGYQLYLFLHSKKDNFLHKRKFPIYFAGEQKKRFVQNVNGGKNYC